MLDEFPALERLDFFETALAFMAGYGLKNFLIAQSLNQIQKAHGENNAILDNRHVRVVFATNDERTARRARSCVPCETRGAPVWRPGFPTLWWRGKLPWIPVIAFDCERHS
jgi:type IV secretion system protein VirD4